MLLHVLKPGNGWSVSAMIDCMQSDSKAYMIALSADIPDTVDKGQSAKGV